MSYHSLMRIDYDGLQLNSLLRYSPFSKQTMDQILKTLVEAKFHQRTSQFFANENQSYSSFKKHLSDQDVDPSKIPYLELELKCCGYGYFPDVQDQMKKRFISYLSEVLNTCQSLKTVKITFNGFTANDTIDQICKIIMKAFDQNLKQSLKCLWLCTTHLTKCSERQFASVLEVAQFLGNYISVEEINLQLSDWSFGKGPLSFDLLSKCLNKFLEVIHMNFKKFRLELSSWYSSEKDAYLLLKDTLTPARLQNMIVDSNSNKNQESRSQKKIHLSKLDDHDRKQSKNQLKIFLENMDSKMLDSKRKWKKEQAEQEKQFYQKMDLYNYAEAYLDEKLIKYPEEYITQMKVEEFHTQMIKFLGGLMYLMPQLEQYHIDMRNWHSLFAMSSLKKVLDTKVGNKAEFSLIRKGLAMMSRKVGGPGGNQSEAGLKTIYMM